MLSPVSAEFARRQGFDAPHVQDLGMLRAPDEAILGRARRERRVVVTLDLDFPRIVALTGEADRPSVVVLRLRPAVVPGVNEAILRVGRLAPGTFRNAVILVEPDRIRVRFLPLPTAKGAAS